MDIPKYSATLCCSSGSFGVWELACNSDWILKVRALVLSLREHMPASDDPHSRASLMMYQRNVSNVSTGHAAGLIIDTPPAFATSSSGDHRNNLIKACIESFKGLPTLCGGAKWR